MRNLISSLYLFLCRAAAVMIQLRLVQQWFGANYSGLNVVLNQVTYYVLIAELGLSAATLSLLFEPVHQGNHSRAAALVQAMRGEVLRIIWITGPIAAVLLALYSLHLRQQVPYSVAISALLLSAASSFLTLMALPFHSYINASDRIFEANLILGTGFLVKTATGLAMARFTHSYLTLVVTFPIVSALELIALRMRFQRLIPRCELTAIEEARKDIRDKARFVLVHRLGGVIYYQSDFLILSLSSSLALVGEYAQYQYLAAGLLGLFTAGANAVTTRLARVQMPMVAEERRRFYGRTSESLFFAAILSSALFLLTAPSFVHAFFHIEPLENNIQRLIAILLLLNLCKTGDDIWINVRGAFQFGYTFPLFESAGYIVMGILLVRSLGIAGVLLAGIATNLVFSFGLRLIVLARAALQVNVARVAQARGRAAMLALLLASPALAFAAYLHRSLSDSLGHSSIILAVSLAYLTVILVAQSSRLRRMVRSLRLTEVSG